MQPAGILARAADRGDLPLLRAVLARAFADDPVTKYLVGEAASQRRLERFFGAEVEQWLRKGEVLTTPNRAAAGLWGKPGRWKAGLGDSLRSSPAMMVALRHRLPRGIRVLSMMERAHPRVPHWYLALLGTDPPEQGKGLAAAVIDAVLERCDNEGLGAYLESSKETNIPYYERFGFTVTGEIAFPDGPTMWPMWRDPQP